MISVGIDIGTTTLRGSAVDIQIADFGERRVGPVAKPFCVFTPYDDFGEIDLQKVLTHLRQWAKAETLPTPDVGTLLFTGEALRAANHGRVAAAVMAEWEGLLSAQLDPHLESLFAAYGSGAVALSAQRLGTPVMHIDVGGGTSNFAWIENGNVRDTACLDLGARKWILEKSSGKILRKAKCAHLLEAKFPEIFPCTALDIERAGTVAEAIANSILSPDWSDRDLVVTPWNESRSEGSAILSLSGGVVECLHYPTRHPFEFGDLGPQLATALLARAKAGSRELHLSQETGRATALGISTFSFQMSGGSIHSEGTTTRKNVPLVSWKEILEGAPRQCVATYLPELDSDVEGWADRIHAGIRPHEEIVILLKKNLGKALGYHLAKRRDGERPKLLILDEVNLEDALLAKGVATVDLKPLSAERRYAVTVKFIGPLA